MHLLGLLSAEVTLSCSFKKLQLYMFSLIAAIINIIIRSIIIIIINFKEGDTDPFTKLNTKMKQQCLYSGILKTIII